jgi:hypothetical protein
VRFLSAAWQFSTNAGGKNGTILVPFLKVIMQPRNANLDMRLSSYNVPQNGMKTVLAFTMHCTTLKHQHFSLVCKLWDVPVCKHSKIVPLFRSEMVYATIALYGRCAVLRRFHGDIIKFGLVLGPHAPLSHHWCVRRTGSEARKISKSGAATIGWREAAIWSAN